MHENNYKDGLDFETYYLNNEDKFHDDLSYFFTKEYIKKLPVFAKIFFLSRYIEDDFKFYFRNNFIYRYIDDEEYRNKMEGAYIFIVNHKFEGVYSSNNHNFDKKRNTVDYIKIEEHDVVKSIY